MNCCEQNKPYGCNEGRDCPVRGFDTAMHRVVQRDDPAPTDDSGHPVGWAVVIFAIACAIALTFLRVKLNLPF